MKTKWLVICCALALFGCQGEAQETQHVGDFQVDTLFTKDGCTVYRFGDNGASRYFARCENTASVEWRESCGKNCTRSVEVPTSNAN